jgi:glutathione S-transferase
VPPPDLTLYGLERSVYTRIARLALEEKGVAYRLEEVEIFGPEGVPPAHRERHPFGRIPVLQHGGFVLYETAAITRYVDEAFAGPALQPAEASQRARMQQLIGLLDAYAYRPMVWGVFVERVRKPLTGVATNENEVGRSLAAARTALRALEALVRPAPFLLGRQPTLADLHAYPMLRCFALAPEGRSTLGEHPALEAWLDTMDRRESVQHTRSRYEQAPA